MALWDGSGVRVHTDDGIELNAEFHVEVDQGLLSVVLDSAGGATAVGDRSRNSDYVPALRLLLSRLRERRAVLVSAVVASTRVAGLPEDQRVLVEGPLRLVDVGDIEALRLSITSAQGRIGLPPGAQKLGNNRKRIRLRLDVPGYNVTDTHRLGADLSLPIVASEGGVGGGAPPQNDDPAGVMPEAGDLLCVLIGEPILTTTGRVNTILAVRGDTAVVQTDRSPQGQPVDVADVQLGLDLLAARGSVSVTVAELGHRSSFVAAVLATLPGAHVEGRPPVVTIEQHSDGQQADRDPDAAVRHEGRLESSARVKVRGEQAKLRRLLAGGADTAACALCGGWYPMPFLVAAHIKRRAACSDDERRNLRHVAMLACTFGCDALYESGWITVDADGLVQVRSTSSPAHDIVHARLHHLNGRRCSAHTEFSEPYFAWHRTRVWDPASEEEDRSAVG